MKEMIKIKNCNCIQSAEIEIEKNALNIKYGSNGTGKSTICDAIFCQANGDKEKLKKLLPYGASEDRLPSVESMNFSKVRVFDETYVNSYLFKEKSFLENSYSVFLRSKECEKLTDQINGLLDELQGIFDKSETIQGLRGFLPQYCNAVKYNDGNISKKGGVGEFVKGNGGGFEKHIELEPYRPFYEGRDMASVTKWAKWRNDGIKQIHGDNCPFCTEKLKSEINKQNEVIAKVFKNSALSTANEVLEYIQTAIEKGYMKKDAADVLRGYIGGEGNEDALISELSQLGIETDYLYKKIQKICFFRPMNVSHQQLNNIENDLNDMYIDKRQIRKFYSTKIIFELSEEVESKINILKKNTGKLRGLFIQHDKKLNSLIERRKDDINQFFALAGFPYKFEIKPDGENKALSYLVPSELEEEKVLEPDNHLSWGEKNAFSLVMFMFEAVSEDADLIVLDDPITSFDKDKKFAVIRRLFDNQKLSFRDRTVVMLTHDMQPLIDYVYSDFFKRYGLTTPVDAKWIQNEKGIINEYSITKEDLLNTVELTKKIASNDANEMAIRVVNMRKYIELTKPNFVGSEIYDVLSNIIHGRDRATKSDGYELLDDSAVQVGMHEINTIISGVTYTQIIQEVDTKKLYSLLGTRTAYEEIIAVRLLFERYSGLLTKLKKEYPAACKFVNETNHVENDYIFQLDPFKFFEIPQCYLHELISFLNCHRNEIEEGIYSKGGAESDEINET